MRSLDYYVVFSIFATLFCFVVVFRSSTSTTSDTDFIKDTQYGVICDAGSSGTRIFVYKFSRKSENEMIDIDTLIHENSPVIMKVSPGLSTFGDNPTRVVEYFAPLLQFAEKHIPEDLLSSTELLIFATAGMRLLPKRKRDSIISELRRNLPSSTKLKVVESNIKIIDGKWEGIYSWITVNYKLGNFGENRRETAGMIDMGGASVQIAFELPKHEQFSTDNVFHINLGPSDSSENFRYKLFATTFLGYGANEGLRRYENSLVSGVKNYRGFVNDSCAPFGMIKKIKNSDKGEFTLKGNGQWDKCVKKVRKLIDEGKNKKCIMRNCYLQNTLAPNIDLSKVELFGFSEYWYTTKNFGNDGTYYYHKFSNDVRKFCSKSWSRIQYEIRNKQFPNIDVERIETNCFKAAWIMSVLHDGFNVNKDFNRFQSIFKIEGEEMQWALGAMIYHNRKLSKRGISKGDVGETANFIILSFISVFVLIVIFKKLNNGSVSRWKRLEPSYSLFV